MWNSSDQIKLTRAELHQLVWSLPMRKAATQIGVSDVALGKACRRHDIPTPPKGYWLRPEPRSAPLPIPKLAYGDGAKVTFMPATKSIEETPVPDHPEIPSGAMLVYEHLRSAVPEVKTAFRELNRAQTEKGLLVCPRTATILDVRVSREQLERALRIFDAVIRATSAAGGRWVITAEATRLEAFGGSVEVGVLEKRKRVLATASRHVFEPNHDLVPTGLLAFRMGREEAKPASMKDATGSLLESKIGSVVKQLLIACARHKVNLDYWAEEARRNEERRERILANRKETERKRILRQRLIDAAGYHQKANSIRQMCSQLLASGAVERSQEPLDEWVKWALKEADDMDPLTKPEGLPSEMVLAPELVAHIKLSHHD